MRPARLLGYVLVVAALIAPAAGALDRGSMGTISPDNPRISGDHPPLTSVYTGASAFAFIRPTACRTVTYCDTHELSVSYPPDLLREDFFGIVITLTWENPRTEDNPTGNDLDLFVFFDDDDPASGRPINNEECTVPEAEPCDNIPSEEITITEPEATGGEAENPPYRMTVVNHAGVNTGYTLTVEWFTYELDAPPDFERPGGDVATPRPTARPAPAVLGPSPASTPATDAGPRTVLVPGLDGEPVEVDLPVLAAGQRLAADAEQGWSPWIGAGIIGGLVAIVMGWTVVARLRREGDADQP